MTGGSRGSRAEPPSDLPAALDVAYRFLAARPRTRAEVARRLRRAGIDDSLVEACLARLADSGYVDDRAFARYWIEQRDAHAPRGAALLRAELRRLGVDDEAVRVELAARRPEIDSPTGPAPMADAETRRAEDALRRWLRGAALELSDQRAAQRATAYLARRGFDYDVARTALRAVGTTGHGDPADTLPEG